MTPSKLGALIAVCLTGLSDEAAGEPPPLKMSLTEPFSAPKVELTRVTRTREATLPASAAEAGPARSTDEECNDGPRVRTAAARPEPAQMQRFANARVSLRWTLPRPTTAVLVFEQPGQEIDLARCLRLQALKLTPPPLERKKPPAADSTPAAPRR
jgi:hypothetical protein